MNKNDHISAILDSWDYDEAIAALRKYSSSPAMADVLDKGRTGFFQKKLRNELICLLDKEEAPAPVLPTQAPADVLAMQKRRNDALRKQDHLRGRLVVLVEQGAEQSVLAPLAREIRDLSKELRTCWDALRHYDQYGTLPPPVPDELAAIFNSVATVSELTTIRNNARSNVSRAKKGKIPMEKLPLWESIRDEADKRIKILEA